MIQLDEVTLAAYQAQSVASARAALVVAALSGTVVAEVFDGNGVLRASGTMSSPWATASGANITVGAFVGGGVLVTSGGIPDASWYMQFRSGTKFVRGSFGLAGSDADFVWSLSTFATGARGVIASVVFTALGDTGADDAPVNVTLPTISGIPYIGSTLTASTGRWNNQASTYTYQWQSSANGSTGWTNIGTGITYTVQPGDAGKFFRVGVVGSSVAIGAGAIAYSAATVAASTASTTNGPLLFQSALSYQGAFRVPFVSETGYAGGTYGGIGYDPAGNGGAGSIFMRLNGAVASVMEFSIPTPVNSGTLGALPVATQLQLSTDVLNGQTGSINTSSSTASTEAIGLHVSDGYLFVSANNWYDANNAQRKSHFRRSRTLSDNTGIIGPTLVTFAVNGAWNWTGYSTTQISRWTGGVMCNIPSAWQTPLGGKVLTGFGGQAINSSISNGPTATAFDPAALTSTADVTGTLSLGYPYVGSLAPDDAQPLVLALPAHGAANSTWNVTGKTYGVAFPDNYRTLLYMGRIGTGAYSYGAPGNVDSNSGITIVDPSNPSQGSHAYPYRYKVWAYDANDLAAVVAATKAPHEVKPYSEWFLTLPFEVTNSSHIMHMAYDDANRKLFVAAADQDTSGSNPRPLVHVFTVT